MIRCLDPSLAVGQWRLSIMIIDKLVSVCFQLVIVTIGTLVYDNPPSVIKQIDHIHWRGTGMNLKIFCCSGQRLDRSIEVFMLSGPVTEQVDHNISDVDMTLFLVILQLIADSGSAREIK